MRCSSKVLFRKIKQIRNQNWSVPAMMFLFIAICMMIIVVFENLGLLNKENNLNKRFITPDITLQKYIQKNKTVNLLNNTHSSSCNSRLSFFDLQYNQKHNDKPIKIVEKEKIKDLEKKNTLLQDILLSAADYQQTYDNNTALRYDVIFIKEGIMSFDF